MTGTVMELESMKKYLVKNLFSIFAVIISILALIVSVKSSYFTQQNNKLSVRPILQFGYTASPNSEQYLNFRVKNVGLGPAIINNIEFVFNGEKVDTSAESLNFIAESALGFPLYCREISRSQVIEAGSEYYIFRFPDKGEVTGVETGKTKNFFRGISIKIEYESIYKEPEIALYGSL